MLEHKLDLIVLANQFLKKDFLAGGERLLVELLKRWQNLEKLTVLIPDVGAELLKEGVPDISYVQLPVRYFRVPNNPLAVVGRWLELAIEVMIV